MEPVTVDFETEGIEFGSGLSPLPVGVAIWVPGQEPQYLSWGHPTNNNCGREDGIRALSQIWGYPKLFHHAKFDIGVACSHLGLDEPQSAQDDTQFLIYLDDPHASSVSLKPSAERLLGLPPDEQDAIGDWLRAERLIAWNAKQWGHLICKAPGDLVGKYAIGDVVRTKLIYDKLRQSVEERNMLPAYERECRLSPILAEAERIGVRIDRARLEQDTAFYEEVFQRLDSDIRALLRCGVSVNLDSGPELTAAILASGLGNEEAWPRTPTGKLSTSRDNLLLAISDASLVGLLSYRGALKTLLGTFMRGWLKFSTRDGRLHPSWNQVRGDDYGTRTGRLSCSDPNLQNIPDALKVPPPPGYPPLPHMRVYILPDDGEILISCDYKSQEMRLLAHFAEGRLMELYVSDPEADLHQVAAAIVSAESGLNLDRKATKIVGFGLIYGEGVPSLSRSLKVPTEEGRAIKNAYFGSMWGLEEFMRDVSSRNYVRTWGGRILPVEPPKLVKGRWMTFDYKLVNYLIQGSAADQTKESILRYHSRPHKGRFLMTVHDENVFSVPVACIQEELVHIKWSMEEMKGFDVPFRVDAAFGGNWDELTSDPLELLSSQHLHQLSATVQTQLYRQA